MMLLSRIGIGIASEANLSLGYTCHQIIASLMTSQMSVNRSLRNLARRHWLCQCRAEPMALNISTFCPSVLPCPQEPNDGEPPSEHGQAQPISTKSSISQQAGIKNTGRTRQKAKRATSSKTSPSLIGCTRDRRQSISPSPEAA
ncbi:hypothetical protein A1332_15695 [Methylomonas methanica]|uniref:Uncharacterized protein n=1 Tax=Methylomonas methanica TaxID=421 RepID=A0A177MFI1_METMH|nr:hypothetical protein A1332_15695 [Methylomonas methanica]